MVLSEYSLFDRQMMIFRDHVKTKGDIHTYLYPLIHSDKRYRYFIIPSNLFFPFLSPSCVSPGMSLYALRTSLSR